MTRPKILIYATWRGIRVRVLEMTELAAHIKALQGEPFTIYGSKYPYYRAQSDHHFVDKTELEDVKIIDLQYEEACLDDWEDEQRMYQQLRNGG